MKNAILSSCILVNILGRYYHGHSLLQHCGILFLALAYPVRVPGELYDALVVPFEAGGRGHQDNRLIRLLEQSCTGPE